MLLDRNKNIIVTDFGFANVFDVNDNLNSYDIDNIDGKSLKRGDLMQTSCGSPCYAAPELVIGEGCYVGRKVDVWSCGVILYAMLAGYLPFDDDPNNPDGDNINLLYKYIINTPLTFPEYVSALARDLLKKLLVPDPKRRASLQNVTTHPWLTHYTDLFDISTDNTELSMFSASCDKRYVSSGNISQIKSHFKANREKYNSHIIDFCSSSGYIPRGNRLSSLSNEHKRHTVHIDYEQPIVQHYKRSNLNDEIRHSKHISINGDFSDMMSALNISSLAQNVNSHDVYNSSTLTPVSEDNKTTLFFKGPTKISASSQLNKLPVPFKKPRPTSYQSPVGIFEGSNSNCLHSLHSNTSKHVKRNSTFIPMTNPISSKTTNLYENNELYVTRAPPSLLPIPIVSKNAELSRPPSPIKYNSNITTGNSLGKFATDDKCVTRNPLNAHKRGSNSISIGTERIFGKIWSANLHHSSHSSSTDKNNKNVQRTIHVESLNHTELEPVVKPNVKNKSFKISKAKKIFTSNSSNEKNTSATRVMDWFIRKKRNKETV